MVPPLLLAFVRDATEGACADVLILLGSKRTIDDR
jgi:hypothetical protein